MNRDRRSYAGLLWGGLLIALGAALLVQTAGLIPAAAQTWFAAVMLVVFGAGFLVIYLASPARWWTLIPGGTLLSIGVVTGLTPFVPEAVAGAAFLFGLSATFAAVALTPAPTRPRTWAWIPAGALALLAVLTLGSAAALVAFVWPLVLIVAGAYVIAIWMIRGRRRGA